MHDALDNIQKERLKGEERLMDYKERSEDQLRNVQKHCVLVEQKLENTNKTLQFTEDQFTKLKKYFTEYQEQHLDCTADIGRLTARLQE